MNAANGSALLRANAQTPGPREPLRVKRKYRTAAGSYMKNGRSALFGDYPTFGFSADSGDCDCPAFSFFTFYRHELGVTWLDYYFKRRCSGSNAIPLGHFRRVRSCTTSGHVAIRLARRWAGSGPLPSYRLNRGMSQPPVLFRPYY